MNIRKAAIEDFDQCIEIARSLGDWFDAAEIIAVEKSIKYLPTYIYEDGDVIFGYIILKEKSDKVIEIENIGVDLNAQHKGIGTALLKYVENQITNGRIIEVKTLDSSSNYKPYIQTRAFYENYGFVKIEVISPYPGWSTDCPCAIYIK